MTPALTPAIIPENHLQGVPCRMLERSGFLSVFPHFRPPVTAKSENSDHLWKSPDPLCGAGFVGRGAQSDPLPLSCTFFDLPVHPLFLSVLNSLEGAYRSHGFDTGVATVEGGCYPPLMWRATQRRTGCHAECALSSQSARAFAVRRTD